MSNRNSVFGMFGNGTVGTDMFSRKDAAGINAPHGAAETPQFLIRSKDIFSSEVENYAEDAAPCLHFEIGYAKKNTYDASGENMGDGRLVARTPLVFMRNGSWVPKILERMTTGTLIEKIEVMRMQRIQKKVEAIRTMTFKYCEIVHYEEGLQDTICFAFNFLSMLYVQDVFSNFDHTKLGAVGVNYDFEEWKGGDSTEELS